MTCPRCDALARQLADVRDELEAYKAHARETPKGVTDEYVAYRRLLGVAGASVRLLEALLAKPGAVLSPDAALRITSGQREVTTNVAQVQMHRLRKALQAHGLTVRTMWGAGWYLTPDDAARIRELIA